MSRMVRSRSTRVAGGVKGPRRLVSASMGTKMPAAMEVSRGMASAEGRGEDGVEDWRRPPPCSASLPVASAIVLGSAAFSYFMRSNFGCAT